MCRSFMRLKDFREVGQPKRELGVEAQSSRSWPMRDGTSDGMQKDDDKVRSLIKSMSESIESLCFDFDLTNPTR